MLLALVKKTTSKGMMHGKLLTHANVRHLEATTPNKKRTSVPTKVGAEARCMSYAINSPTLVELKVEAFRSRTYLRFAVLIGSVHESAAACRNSKIINFHFIRTLIILRFTL